MINFEKHILQNGLTVIVHQDTTTPIVAFNILYHVGAKDEDPAKTGFAHLFEHLMFEGSVNIPRYDEHVEKAAGQNNAFTNNDITNYYLTLPKQNIETAFWLESDRMLGLDLTPEKVQIQKQVVMEEFRQRYLNQPYGDIWLLLRPLSYKVHPYRWPTIGMDLSHIEKAEFTDIASFFEKHYTPANAILTIAGDVDPQQMFSLAEKWFGPIDRPYNYYRNLPEEPRQTEKRQLTVKRDVPLNALYKTFHTRKRSDSVFIISDMISDILSRGDSSRLHQELVKNNSIFNDISAFVTGETESGLLIVGGKINQEISVEEAEKAMDAEINKLIQEPVSLRELDKIKNQAETSLKFSEMKVQEKAMTLAFYEHLGDVTLWETEYQHLVNAQAEEILQLAQEIFTEENASTLYYLNAED
ncbi:MAG: M16 family metallopeptidase [Bacteroidales bacterium]